MLHVTAMKPNVNDSRARIDTPDLELPKWTGRKPLLHQPASQFTVMARPIACDHSMASSLVLRISIFPSLESTTYSLAVLEQ